MASTTFMVPSPRGEPTSKARSIHRRLLLVSRRVGKRFDACLGSLPKGRVGTAAKPRLEVAVVLVVGGRCGATSVAARQPPASLECRLPRSPCHVAHDP